MLRISKILKENIPNKIEFLFGIFLSILSASISLVLPLLIGEIINPKTVRYIMNNKVYLLLGIIFVLFIYLFQGLSSFILGRVGTYAMKNLQNKFIKHVLKLPVRSLESYEAGDLGSRLTNDVSEISQLVTNTIPKMITNLIIVIGSIIFLFKIDTILTLMLLGMLIFLCLIIVPLNNKMESLSNAHQNILGKINGIFNQRIQNIAVIKSYLGEKYEESLIGKFTNYLAKNTISLIKVSIFYNSILSSLLMIFLIFIIYFASYAVLNHSLTIGLLVAYILYAIQAISPTLELLDGLSEISEINGAMNRIDSIFKLQKEKVQSNDKNISLTGPVEFKHVTFSYNKEDIILNNISLKANNDELTAIVGPSGAGKSTIFSLILKFFDNYSGDIFIGNKNLKDLTIATVRSQISMVFQNNLVFEGNILDNIRYGKNKYLSSEKVKNLLNFIDLPKDLQFNILENGKNLSGGQKQKINIVRALLSEAKIILFDEVTSNLDSNSELNVMNQLDKIKRDHTLLVIAHKLNTIKMADKIYVLESNGAISGFGTHEELLESNKTYRKFYSDLKNN